MGVFIHDEPPVRSIKKASWLLLMCYVASSFFLTIWGGCLLLGALTYVMFTKIKSGTPNK
ncbi:hypothetical protein [Paenibacillus ferrarius]|uniref:hypothetical protein n=1 Tax=Paenibacillus ferrarius TaxID=1469647 RepID=UPI0011801050|nr:hypothetical protein [Paenibacillus ferrarius]